MHYTKILAEIAGRVKDTWREGGRSLGPHSWEEAVSVRVNFLRQAETNMRHYLDRKKHYEFKGPEVDALDIRVKKLSALLDLSDKLWTHALNNYTPDSYVAGMNQGGSQTSQNNLVKPLQKNTAAQESDPHGKDAHEPGAKMDDSKLRAGLVLGDFSLALEKVVEVGTYGANKYSDSGWLEVPDAVKRYHDAFHRHLLKHDQGESLDPESGLPHFAHLAWNALAILELWSREKDNVSGGEVGKEGK